MKRREFIGNAGLALGATAIPVAAKEKVQEDTNKAADKPIAAADWTALRKLFPLTHDYIHLATFLLASHPKPVADTIEKHRKGLDNNPADYYHQHYLTKDMTVAQSAASYMGGDWTQIALTDSTTMGSAMVYSGLLLNPGDEILHTVHDHYATDMAIAHKAKRSGATVRKIALYDDPSATTVEQCVERLSQGITSSTKVVAVTWVHSSTGVKLPIAALAEVVKAENNRRAEADHIIFCVDGVHGFGIENVDVSAVGCDFFIAGTHKWMFGPRGTGVIWGSKKGWQRSEPVIPGFSASFAVWLGMMDQSAVPSGMHFTPGGFHSFEHRWALPEAFKLHQNLGKANVQQRIHALNTRTKQALEAMPHITLHTPLSEQLSSGLVCFEVANVKPGDVTKLLHKKGIIMSASPYRESYARFAPSLLNNEAEIDIALGEIGKLA